VTLVVHAASPVIFNNITDPETQVIQPAISGVKFTLRAALKAGVKKYIFISTVGAVVGFQRQRDPNHVFTENDWNDEMGSPYSKSKTLSEQALWEFAREHPEMPCVSINPAVILGPILDAKVFSSTGHIFNIIKGEWNVTGVPPAVFGEVDIRDVSEGVVKAITNPATNGKRYLFTSARNYAVLDWVRVVEEQFPGQFVLPTKVKEDKVVTHRENAFNVTSTVQLLGRDWTPIGVSVRDTINSFKTFGLI